MIALVLAVLSGASYGAADFSGALASKRNNPIVVTVAIQLVSLVALNAVLVAVPEPDRHLVDLGWAALGGLAVAVALTCFYKALAQGPMSTAAATTALVGTVVPVVVGVGLGERLAVGTLLGVACCVPAAVLVSTGAPGARPSSTATPREIVLARRDGGSTFRLSFVAGVGFGVFFVFLSRVSADAGLFPLVGARVASIAALVAVLAATRGWEPVQPGNWRPVLVAGVLDCTANAAYLLAVGRGQLTWVAAISSLYPVSTVLLARVVLHERLSARQGFGLLLSAAALTLVAVSQ